MGVGKSTVGQLAAQRLQWTHIDTDTVIEQETGLSISEIFARDGEEAFRERERDLCRRLGEEPYLVISTGGGMLVDPNNRARLEESGVIVLLTCDREVLIKRLAE